MCGADPYGTICRFRYVGEPVKNITIFFFADCDEGHYIAWVKKANGKKQIILAHCIDQVLSYSYADQWYKFDDDKVSIVKDADIERLEGGGGRPFFPDAVLSDCTDKFTCRRLAYCVYCFV